MVKLKAIFTIIGKWVSIIGLVFASSYLIFGEPMYLGGGLFILYAVFQIFEDAKKWDNKNLSKQKEKK
tara:strand:- start:4427 stop:4630 length:204 start_codon:yes stop_codon:yes gene_type:complete